MAEVLKLAEEITPDLLALDIQLVQAESSVAQAKARKVLMQT